LVEGKNFPPAALARKGEGVSNGSTAFAPLEQDDASGDRYVEGSNLTHHRDADEEIAMFFDVFVKAVSFGAKNQRRRPGVFDFVVEMRAALVETVHPETGLLHLFKRSADIGDAGNGKVFERPGGGTVDGFGERR
jgi:hypothetical protein